MPRIAGTTNAQSRFLRAFRDNPAGPPPHQWPSPAVLRRWMRRPGFRVALQTLRDAHRVQADMHLAAAACTAAATLQSTLADPQAASKLAQLLPHLLQILRLSHVRQRFQADPTILAPRVADLLGLVRRVRGDQSAAHVQELLHRHIHFPGRRPRREYQDDTEIVFLTDDPDDWEDDDDQD